MTFESQQLAVSPQYITKDRINVTILNVIDPAHFVVKETLNLANSSSELKNFIEAEKALQLYYGSVESSFTQLPLKNTIMVVLHEGKFYRAKLMSILYAISGCLFKVYLVDYGIECDVPSQNSYEITKDFLTHPFQAVTIELLGIEPISLVMDKITLDVSYGPVSDWDTSAFIYIKELQKGISGVYIEVQGIDDSKIYGKLFLCYETSSAKCVNDELISKSFGRFNEECWKNIKRIEDAMCNSNVNRITTASEHRISRNENPVQVPCSANFTETVSYSADTKMKKEMVAAKERTVKMPEEQTSLIFQKRFQKLFSMRAGTFAENSQTNINTSEVLSSDNVTNNKVLNLSSSFSSESSEKAQSKTTDLKTEKETEQGSESLTSLIHQKRYQKLLSMRSGTLAENSQTNIAFSDVHSPDNVISNKIINPSQRKDKGDFIPSPVNRNSYKSLSVENYKKSNTGESSTEAKSKTTDLKIEKETEPRFEPQSILQNARKILKLQEERRLKQMKDMLGKSSEFNQAQPANTACDSSLCDSDSGFSSSTSEKRSYCILM